MCQLDDRSRRAWNWVVGPSFGVGIGSPVKGEENNSSAPVVLFSVGVLMELSTTGDDTRVRANRESNYVGIEFGYAHGFTSDESFSGDHRDDGALYVGVTVKIPPL